MKTPGRDAERCGRADAADADVDREGNEHRFLLPGFLRSFSAHRVEALTPFLHDDAVYLVEGLPAVRGRRALLAYWRRVFDSYSNIRASACRTIRDGDMVVAAVSQVYLSTVRRPLALESIALYELRDERIVSWRDTLRSEDVDAETWALWRRLRGARW